MSVELRELNGVAELRAAEAFQVAVWGADERPDNSDIMLALQHEGALIAGAFSGGEMLGFLFGFPCAEAGVQHSHRLGVHPKAQGMGLGVKLKWFQRDWCLARGIAQVRWTYDPLRAINAGLNIGTLGATAGEYLVDYYGEMPGINAGLPSDRLLARWDLNAVRAPIPEGTRVAIPRDFDALLADPAAALRARLDLRAVLQSAFARGERIIGFDRAACAYILG